MSDHIEVTYRFPPGVNAGRQARVIAVGQTAGSWDARFQHREAQLRGHLAEVLSVEPLSDGAHAAKIAFPGANVTGDIGSLLTMIFGKYSLGGPAKVIRLKLPDDYGLRPRFGIRGMRERLGVQGRPLVMAIFKPALGLDAHDHAEILREVAFAGLDIIKDDEILPDLPQAPTLERVRACRRVIEEVGREAGREPLYAVNLSGRADQLLAQARMLVAEGANALLLNVLPYGFSILEALATDPGVQVPIFAHPALAGVWCAAPDHGIDYTVVLGTLMAHGGADAVLYPSHYGSLPFSPETEAGIRDILRGRGIFPVPSAGIHPGVVPHALADYGRDVILNAGGAIMDHPEGPAAGVSAFFEALDRAVPGKAFRLDEIQPGPLHTALVHWGGAWKSRIVFSDFDGTITNDETFVAVLKHFAPTVSERILPLIYARQVTLREGVREILESVPAVDYPRMLDHVRGAPLRAGFAEFLDFLDEHEVPLVIISGGLRGLVETILGPLSGRIQAIYAADVRCDGEKLRVVSEWEAGDELVAKPAILARYATAEKICIGDSITDLNMAMNCPRVFARDRLIGYLEEAGRPFTPFEDFHQIRVALSRAWQVQGRRAI